MDRAEYRMYERQHHHWKSGCLTGQQFITSADIKPNQRYNKSSKRGHYSAMSESRVNIPFEIQQENYQDFAKGYVTLILAFIPIVILVRRRYERGVNVPLPSHQAVSESKQYSADDYLQKVLM
uniref:Uncharacterized protein n=1 Tax=Glossina pallidipes TaxID=7398 RepID=A0A1B0ACC6_GLOPL